ncbi:MAG: hypothetical protein ACYC5Q_04695 [Thermoleophilia bacterium]
MMLDIDPGPFVWSVLVVVFLACMWLVPAGMATYLAKRRRLHPLLGFAVGLVLSWIGVVLLLIPSRQASRE